MKKFLLLAAAGAVLLTVLSVLISCSGPKIDNVIPTKKIEGSSL